MVIVNLVEIPEKGGASYYPCMATMAVWGHFLSLFSFIPSICWEIETKTQTNYA